MMFFDFFLHREILCLRSIDFASACGGSKPQGKHTKKEEWKMQARTFLATLGIGMLAGGAVALMLPQQSQVRKTAQKAVDELENTVSGWMK